MMEFPRSKQIPSWQPDAEHQLKAGSWQLEANGRPFIRYHSY
jgi:hypothetical protein